MTKTTLVTIQLWFKYIFLQHLGVHSSWEATQRDAMVVGSFTAVCLFVYGDDQFIIKLFAISNGIGELIDAQFYGRFHLCKLKTSRLKHTQFYQVRCQCWKNHNTVLKFFVFISRSKTMHTASFLFCDSCFSETKITKILLLALTVALLNNHLVLHARCNCWCFVFIVVWCIARQADRNGETVKHFHNCIKMLLQFHTPSAQICSSTVIGRSKAVRMTMQRHHTYNFHFQIQCQKIVSTYNIVTVCCNSHMQENMLSSNRFTSIPGKTVCSSNVYVCCDNVSLWQLLFW